MQRSNLLFTINLLICILGSLIFIISFIVKISVLGIAGLIIFSGSYILLILLPQKFSKEEIFTESCFSTIFGLSRIISHLKAEGNGLIIPSTTYNDDFVLFVPYKREREPKIPLEVQRPSKQAFMSRGIFLKPIGFSLVELFEKKLQINFSRTDLADLAELLYRVLVEEFNVVTDIYIETVSNRIFLQLVDSIFLNTSWKLNIEASEVLTQIGCPLSSAIGCIISKITGRIVYTASYNIDVKKKLTEVIYNLYRSI